MPHPLRAMAIAAALMGASPVLAQPPGTAAADAPLPGWQEYRYPEQGFAFQLPSTPRVQTGNAATPTGVKAPVRVYSAQGEGIQYSLQVFDLSHAGVNGDTILADTEKAVSASGKVNVTVAARINRQFGRELTLDGADGSRLTVALFFVDQHLYDLTAKALPPSPTDRSAQAIHFQQSLQFIGPDGQGQGGGFGRGAGSGGGRGRFGGGPAGGNPAALTACMGKAAGDKVTVQTPDGGQTQATCVLVARPDRAPQ